MEVYFLRHGAAQQHSSSGRDADRELTPEGVSQLHQVLDRARTLGAHPAAILHSPYTRTVQSAEIAHRILGCAEPLVPCPSLTPDSSVSALWDEIRVMAHYQSILLVTHEPLISAAANWIVRGPERLRFEPGAIARIDVPMNPDPRGVLKWMLP